MKKILICDDEKEILEVLQIYLEREGYEVIKAYDGKEAIDIVENDNDVALIIADLMMPKLDGNNLVKKVRENKNIPIIVLSAKNQDSDKILSLDLGADDYITKPFSPLEIVARVNAQIRRVYKLSNDSIEKVKSIKIGDIELDTYNIKVIVRGKEIELTSMEYGILEYLMQNAGRI